MFRFVLTTSSQFGFFMNFKYALPFYILNRGEYVCLHICTLCSICLRFGEGEQLTLKFHREKHTLVVFIIWVGKKQIVWENKVIYIYDKLNKYSQFYRVQKIIVWTTARGKTEVFCLQWKCLVHLLPVKDTTRKAVCVESSQFANWWEKQDYT